MDLPVPTPQINAAMAAVNTELAPWVKYIRYNIGEDWTGQLAIYFRVMLSDAATSESNLHFLAPRISRLIWDNLDIPSHGMFPHVNLRGESEQAKLNEPRWA